jgi:hypothetical protein
MRARELGAIAGISRKLWSARRSLWDGIEPIIAEELARVLRALFAVSARHVGRGAQTRATPADALRARNA